jgi:hypothetical protein
MSFPFKTNPIYKINSIVDEETIGKIIVFYGDVLEEQDLNTLFKQSPKHISFIDKNSGLPIFTDDELAKIQEHTVEVIFSQQQIHYDDSIGVIKLKIIEEFSKLGDRFSLDETYLFSIQFQTLDAVKVYQSLTQNEQLPLTRTRLNQFLLNIIFDENMLPVEFDIQDKEIYDYQDILALNISGRVFGVNHALDKKLFAVSNEFPFVVNPFDCDEYDKFTETAAIHNATTLNSHLLLDNGYIVGNNIYLCCANHVLAHAQKLQSTTDIVPMELYVSELYYPFLTKQKITSLDELENQKYKLMEETEKKLSETTLQTFKKIDLFYDLYKERKNNLTYHRGSTGGIQSIKLTVLSTYKYKIPLDVIFKLIHTTEDRPLVKFNPATKKENIYRLYADKYASDGRKIPYLQKATIFKLMKDIGKTHSVAVYATIQYDDIDHQIICEFEENGNIRLSCQFEETVDIQYIEDLFKTAITPIVDEVKIYLEQNGYSMNTFVSIFDKNVEINQITYSSSIVISKPIQLNKISGCINPIFVIESDDGENNIEMRYKRVSNFNKMNSINAFVVEKQRQGVQITQLVDEIVHNYEVSQEEATDIIKKVVSELQLERGVRNEFKIKENPGFKTLLQYNKFTQILTIQVQNIDNIYYLYVLPIYLDTLVRLTQDDVVYSSIRSICSDEVDVGIEEEKELVINDIENVVSDGLFPVIENGELILTDENVSDEKSEKQMDAFDLLFGDDFGEEEEGDEGDDEGDDEEQEEDGGSLNGGAKTKTKKDVETVQTYYLDGLSLKHPNPFQEQMERLDPVLFQTKKKTGKFDGYSRMCLSNNRVQPIILTDEERETIEKETPGIFKKQDILRYGSDPSKQYNYVCPRYWCMKTKRPMSKEEVDSGVCGKVIPKDAKVIPPGHYVYEFFNPAQHGTQDKYVQHYPGFIKDTCLPCCYKNWNTPDQIERRQKCIKEEEEKEKVDLEKEKVDLEKEKVDLEKEKVDLEKEEKELPKENIPVAKKPVKSDYIKGPEKFPLGLDRWGYLPLPIQMFFKEPSTECQVSNVNTNLKKNYTCMLRHGVENNQKQSFIACIADILFYGERMNKIQVGVPTIKIMKEKIIESITLDTFLTLQNGDLVSLFTEKESKEEPDLDVFKTTALFSRLNMDLKEDRMFFNSCASSFLHFIDFLRSDDSTIDYTYLWDIICKPNPKLFDAGLNLIILEMANNDTTNNVDLICPTNHYSNEIYNSRYPTAIIIQNGDYFEPVYFKTDIKDKFTLKKTYKHFDPKGTQIMTRLKEIFAIIKRNLNKCIPLQSVSKNVYKFKQPLLLNDLIGKLERLKYTILRQVVNYQSKVIYVFVQGPEKTVGLVPCFPSSIIETREFVLMNNDDLFQPYERIVPFLKRMSEISKQKIPCKPRFKVLEDEMIIGILTETNQFIQVSEPLPISEVNDDLETIRDTNYLIVDKKTTIQDKDDVDIERVEYIQKIKLETKFYNIFRNTVRILLNKYENIKLRTSIEEELRNPYTLYDTKLKNVIQKLITLVKKVVVFSDDYDTAILDEMSTCVIIENADKCNSAPLCSYNENTCQMIIPKTNLLTSKNNMIHYYGKMADELVRYNRINAFIFQPQTYHSFGSLGYNLRENEIIIIQSLLNQEYFNDLDPVEENKYVHYNTYDTVQPIQSITYNNVIPLQGTEEQHPDKVSAVKRTNIHSTKWVKCFPSSFGEFEYKTDDKKHNGFYMLIDLIQKVNGETLSIFEIKHILIEEYEKYLFLHEDKIINILIQQGKIIYGNQVKSGVLSFENFIFSDEYFITNLDIWVILEKFDIPGILISTKKIQQSENNAFAIGGDETSDYVFILCPAMRSEKLPEYSIIWNNDTITFPLSVIQDDGECIQKINMAIQEKKTLEEYLRSYMKPTAVKTKTKMRLEIVEEEPEPTKALAQELIDELVDEYSKILAQETAQEIAQETAEETLHELLRKKSQEQEQKQEIPPPPKKKTKKATLVINKKTRRVKPKTILEIIAG